MDAWTGIAFLFGLGIGFVGGWLYVTLARLSAVKHKKKNKYAIRRVAVTTINRRNRGRGGIVAF